MRQFFRVTTFALLLTGTAVTANPQKDADYIVSQTMTEELFAGAIAAQRGLIISAIQNDLRQQGITLPDPDRFFDLFMEEFLAEFTQSMRDQSAEIYIDRFDDDDLAAIAAFYKTSAGQALIAATPDLMMAGAEMGQQAGQLAGINAGARLADRIEAEGLIVVEDPNMLQRLLDSLR